MLPFPTSIKPRGNIHKCHKNGRKINLSEAPNTNFKENRLDYTCMGYSWEAVLLFIRRKNSFQKNTLCILLHHL
jgi:hypothetical protein